MPDNAFASLSLEPVTTVDRVVDELRRAMFEGEIEPATPLREVALADSLGVSRSTVREALGILVAEGLAVRNPNRGTQVRDIDPAAIRDICRARLVLETAGVARWNDCSEASRDAVRTALTQFTELAQTRASSVELTASHLDIHRAFVGLAESARLTAMADALYAEIKLALARVDRVRRNAAEQVQSHAALVRLLERGHLVEADAELQAHLEHAEVSMIASVVSVS
jgi:DNA-binding GntR family transcriptional regulator